MESEERRFKALDFLYDYSKGTLWWVSDDVWKKVIPGFVVKRKGHPGLSLSRGKSEGLHDLIQMAIGLSKEVKGGFEVKNVSAPGPSGKPSVTNFVILRPCRVRFNDFGSAEGVAPNAYKPRLNLSESARLDKMLFGGK